MVRADKKGFLWVATDRGVARFDGNHFVTYSVNDGIGGNVVNDILLAPDSTVWVTADAARLYRYNGTGFDPYRWNSKLNDFLFYKSAPPIAAVQFENNQPAWFSIRPKGLLHIDSLGKVISDSSHYPTQTLRYDRALKLTLYYQQHKINPSYTEPVKPLVLLNGQQYITSAATNCNYLQRKDGSVVIGKGNKVFHIKDDQVVGQYSFENFITTLFEDNEQRLWITCYGAGVFHYPPGKFADKQFEKVYFSDTRISSVTQDREGGFWFGSYDKGIFYVPYLNVTSPVVNLLKPDEFLQEIVADGNRTIYAASSQGRIFKKTGAGPMQLFYSGAQIKTTSNCNDLVYDSNKKNLYGCFSNGACLINTKTGTSLKLPFSARTVQPFGDDFYIVSPTVARLHKAGNISTHTGDGAFFCSYLLPDSSLLVGYENGLLVLRNDHFEPYQKTLINKRVTGIKALSNGWIALSTLGKGLILVHGDAVTGVSLGQADAANMVNDIAVNGNIVWAATEAGIVRVDLSDMNRPLVAATAADNRFPYNNIRKIAFVDNKLYVLAQHQLLEFPATSLVNTTPPLIWLRKVVVNDSGSFKPDEVWQFDHTSNRVSFLFDGVCYKCGASILYQYRLVGLHNNWYNTSQPFVEYPSLPPGDYTFEVMAVNNNNVRSASPASYHFSIPAPFWKKTWFIVQSVLLFMLLSIWLIYFFVKRAQLHNREKELLLTKEQVALSAQINPHFIFNSLNSMQHLIIQEDRQNAVLYMAQFSRLMRLSLDNSRKKWVPVNDEIMLLNLYLELESLRFKDKFVYSILSDNQLQGLNVLIPAMLIQPFVENAIRHGVNHLQHHTGIVTVTLKLQHRYIAASIEDNGIGREKARSLRETESNHLSAGMQITGERLRLLSKEMNTPWSFEIIDKKNVAGEAAGTLVKFNIPYIALQAANTILH